MLEILKTVRLDENFKEVEKPLIPFDNGQHFGQAINNDRNGWGEYNRATEYYQLVTCAEYWRLLIHKYNTNSTRGSYFTSYSDLISQPPTEEACKDMVMFVDSDNMLKVNIVDGFCKATQRRYKTIEHAIHEGIKIYLKK